MNIDINPPNELLYFVFKSRFKLIGYPKISIFLITIFIYIIITLSYL